MKAQKLNKWVGVAIIVCLIAALAALYTLRDDRIPADYCEKVFHISHQDKMDCERAVKALREKQ